MPKKFNPITPPFDYYEAAGAATNGLPIGGTSGQILQKTATDNYACDWVDPTGGGVAIQGSGTNIQTSGTVQFNNGNGVTFGLTNGVMTASIGDYQTTGNYQTAGNYLSTNAGTDYAKNSLFAGTNISGTLNSTAFNLSVAASGNSTSFGSQSGTPSQTTGASSVLMNNGEWGTVITTLGNYQTAGNYASTNDTYWGKQTATPSQTTGASSVLANNGGWVSVNSTTGNFISTGATSGYGTNVPLQTATNNQSNYFLAGDGGWTTAGGAGGGIGTINGNTAAAQTLTVGTSAGLTTVASATNGFTFGISPMQNRIFPQDVWHGNIVTSASTPISTNVTIRAIKLDYPLAFSKIEWPVSIQVASTTNTTSQNVNWSHSVVVYSLNGAVLTPIVGGTTVTTTSVGSASTGSAAGPRMFSVPVATTLNPGDYWVGIQAQTAGRANTLNHIIVSAGSQVANFLRYGQSVTTANFASTGPFAGFPLQGIIVASMSNTTNTWNINQISVAPASYYRANMIFQFKNVTY